jgi:hypothetical protein
MTTDDKPPEGLSLKRWSRRKFEAARENAVATDAAPAPVAVPAPAEGAPEAGAPASAATLPPVDSLTIDSDFTPFFQPKIGETLKRQALRQLLRDPQFNVMDGLDIYVGDYSIPDPISPDVVKQMVQGRYIFDPPTTRVNAQGHVEDVPPEEAVAGIAADRVADASDERVLPSAPEVEAGPVPPQPPTPEVEAPPVPPQPSMPEAEAAPLPLPPSMARARATATAPAAPREIADGAASLPDSRMREDPTR